MEFKNLKRNLNGSIDGDWVQVDGSVKRYTLDPAMGHIKKAEAGVWGVIEEPTQAEKAEAEKAALKEQAVSTVQSIVDSEAQARGYDDINSAAKYTGFNNSFRAESEALLVWCASCWDKLIEIQDTAKTVDDVVSAMPKFVL